MGIIRMKEVVEKLIGSDLGSARDSYNFLLILDKTDTNTFKSYQVCVENNEDYTGRVVYVSDYDLLTEDVVGRNYEIDEFQPYIEDKEVVLVSDYVNGF